MSTVSFASPPEKLPVRTRHGACEPAWSLLQRLAALNGVESITSFCNDYDLKRWDATTPDFIERLARLADVDVEPLLFASPVRLDGKDFRIGEQRVRWAGSSAILFKLGRVGVCPVCLSEDRDRGVGRKEFRSHYRAWWSFPSLTNCPLHDVQMICRSPHDGTLLDPACPDPRRCAGTRIDLSSATTVPADASFERYVVGRLGFMKRTPIDLLDTMSVHEVLNLVLRTGYASLVGPHASLKKNFSDDEIRAWNREGWRILRTGDEGLTMLLDRFVAENDNAHGLVNHASCFGRYYEWIYQEQRFDAANYKAVADFMFDYSTRKFAILPSKSVFNRPIQAQSNFPLTKVIAKLRISLKHGAALVEHLGLGADRTGGLKLLTSDDVAVMQDYLDGLMPAGEVAAQYGMPLVTLRQFAGDAGLIKPAPALGTTGRCLLFEREYLRGWWEQIVGDAPVVEAIPSDAVLLKRSKQEMQVSALAVAKLLDAAKLKCVGVLKGVPLFAAILVSKSQLQEVILPKQKGLCTSAEVSELYGLNRGTLVALVRAGHLEEHQVRRQLDGRKTTGMFKVAELDRFLEKFVPESGANAMYREAQTSLTVRKYGPNPAIAFSRKAAASSFYDRREVEHMIRRAANCGR